MRTQSLKVYRTHDMWDVREIIQDPRISKHLSDEGSVGEAAIDSPVLYWLMVEYKEEPSGVFLFHPHNAITYEVHTAILPPLWGELAKQAAFMARQWIFTQTPCRKLITHVPEYNKLALRFAKQGGLKLEGVNRKSYLFNGELMDQYLLGITKEEACQ